MMMMMSNHLYLCAAYMSLGTSLLDKSFVTEVARIVLCKQEKGRHGQSGAKRSKARMTNQEQAEAVDC